MSDASGHTTSIDPSSDPIVIAMEKRLAALKAKIAAGVKISDSKADESLPVDLKALKATAIDTLETVLLGAQSEDVQRKAAVDILNFSEKTKNETPVTEEQLGWLGRVIIEAEEIRLGLEVSKK